MTNSDRFILYVIVMALAIYAAHELSFYRNDNPDNTWSNNLKNYFTMHRTTDNPPEKKNINSDNANLNNSIIKIKNSKYRLVKITKPLQPNQCNASKSKLGITNCTNSPDYWASAVMACGGKSKMANDNELAQIANDIYGVDYIQGRTDNTYNVK